MAIFSRILNEKEKLYPIAIRFLLYFFVALENIIIPNIFSKVNFGLLQYYRSIAQMAPLLMFGMGTGYLIQYYRGKKIDITELISPVVLIFLVWFIALFFMRQWMVMAISLSVLFFIMYDILEKNISIKRKFVLVFIFKPLISLGLILTGLGTKYLSWNLTPDIVWVIASFIGILPYILYLDFNKILLNFAHYFLSMSFLQKQIAGCLYYIKKGFFISCTTTLFWVFLFADRQFFKTVENDKLAIYSLVMNMCNIFIVTIGTINYIHKIDIGEKFEKFTICYLNGVLIKSFVLFMVIYVVSFVGTFLLPYLFPGYDVGYLRVNFLVLGFGLGVYFVSSGINSYLMYAGKDRIIFYIILFVALMNILGVFFIKMLALSSAFIYIKSSVLLCIAGGGFIYFTKKEISLNINCHAEEGF